MQWSNATSPSQRDIPIALYRQIADALAARIERGDLPPSGRLPSEARIIAEYGVARGTARRAFELLRERGLAVTVAPFGSYAKRPAP